MARSGRPPASPHGAGTNLLELDLKSAERLVRDLGWPRYRAPQIFRWLYQSRVRDIERMTDLSQAERARLRTMATIERLHDCHVLTSADGTRKFRSEEHTSELQSQSNLVCRLLLEKKKIWNAAGDLERARQRLTAAGATQTVVTFVECFALLEGILAPRILHEAEHLSGPGFVAQA